MSTGNGTNGALKDSAITGRTSQGVEIRAALLRLTRFSAIFEIYNPDMVLRISEVIENGKISMVGKTIYSGRIIVKNLIPMGTALVCEAALEDFWLAPEFFFPNEAKTTRADFSEFLNEWQKNYRIRPEFKLVVADMQNFLSDLKLWLDQVELSIHAEPLAIRKEVEKRTLDTLCQPVCSSFGQLLEKFEHVTERTEKEVQPAYARYAKRQLHPLVLCAPFMFRTFHKPLGYAGDYEMVNMMMREPLQGGSIYAKVLNFFFLNTAPVIAHRNRIEHLVRLLELNIDGMARKGRQPRIFNLGCGPALEIQALLRQSPVSSQADFTLMDFNDETVGYTDCTLSHIIREHHCSTLLRVVKKSVAQLLKETSRDRFTSGQAAYHLVYCAGLFDYLTDGVCRKLLERFYQMTEPGGRVVVTNVNSNNPSRGWMEYIVDWHLFYRSPDELAALVPDQIPPDSVRVVAEPTGVNIFVEFQKPENA